MQKLNIPVTESIAAEWEAAGAEQRAHILTVFCWLVEKSTAHPTSFSKLLDQISDKAETNWLTPEILNEISKS